MKIGSARLSKPLREARTESRWKQTHWSWREAQAERSGPAHTTASRWDFSLEAMELSATDLSIYDKLSETIDLVRQTGHQCGMSEKAIEKFIKQLLERNEPQRGPPRYPILVAVYKGLLMLGLVLLTVYFVIQPYSLLPPEAPLSRAHSWGSLIGHLRLLSLPIAKKYMLEKCQDWWTAGCRQNTSTLPTCCTACSSVKSLQIVTDFGELSEELQRSQPFLIKTGQHLSYEELKHFQSQHPELAEVVIEENSSELWSCLPRQSFPFFFPWSKSVDRTQILQEFFPASSSLSFHKTVSLETCFLIRHPDLGNKSYSLHGLFAVGSGQLTLTVVPLDKCRGHCEMFKVELEAGDLDVFWEKIKLFMTFPVPSGEVLPAFLTWGTCRSTRTSPCHWLFLYQLLPDLIHCLQNAF